MSGERGDHQRKGRSRPDSDQCLAYLEGRVVEDGPFVDSGGLQFVFWHHLGTKGQHLKEEREKRIAKKMVSWKTRYFFCECYGSLV